VSTPADPGSSGRTQHAMAQLLEQHAEQLAALLEGREEDRASIRQLRADLDQLTTTAREQRGYEPVPPPRWWELEGREREQAINLLREWVTTVFVPGYEQLADDIGTCWPEHPACLFILDWLSEWHKYLYLRDHRTAGQLGAMAEWTTRFMPVAVQMLQDITRNCRHREAAALRGEMPFASPVNGRQNGGRHG
jgi:hypothetical protein